MATSSQSAIALEGSKFSLSHWTDVGSFVLAIISNIYHFLAKFGDDVEIAFPSILKSPSLGTGVILLILLDVGSFVFVTVSNI